MKTTKLKISVASALLFLTASAQALQPEVLYAFQVAPRNPHASLVQGSDGNFYGTSEFGGKYGGGGYSGFGTVFQVTTNGLVTTLCSFGNTNGTHPRAGLVSGRDGHFYGTTARGGSSDHGTVFRVTTNGTLTTLVSFDYHTNGMSPQSELVLGDDGHFYGTTAGWINWRYPNPGTVFRVTTNGVLTTLASTGPSPSGLVLGNDGNLYGTTAFGGSGGGDGAGTVFKVTTNGVLTTLAEFTDADGQIPDPSAGLVLGSDGYFYGTTLGSRDVGTVFRVSTNGVLTSLTFTAQNSSRLVLGSDGYFYGTTEFGGASGFGTVFKLTTNGVLTALVSFNNTNGANPQAGLVLGSNGSLYGTTYGGGSRGYGTVFKVTTGGVLTSLAAFTDADGAEPHAVLVLGRNGSFYGTTLYGGSNNCGTVFQMTSNGVLTYMASFNKANGANPFGGLMLGNDGNFYGTTANGGSGYVEGSKPGYGTVFKITTNGVLTTLTSFTGTNGTYPLAGLVLGSDGNLYGTTYVGGGGGCGNGGQGSGCGTVFQVTTNGVVTTLVSFTGENGRNPEAGLVLGSDSNFYGTTSSGGLGGGGTLFKVTHNGMLTTLVSFSSAVENGSGVYTNANGARPQAGLTLGSDGDFYSTTSYGGIWGYGTVFKVTTSGLLTTLVSFAGTDGAYSRDGLVLGSDGNFYGTTWLGGASGAGTVFKVTTNGVLTSVVSFNDDNGANPIGGLVLGSDSNFYGTTAYHGPGGGGTIFGLVISAFTSVARLPGGRVLLTGTGPANGSYRLWANTNLSLPVASWTLLTSASFDSNGNFSYKDASAISNPSRFYQLSVP